MGCLFLFRICVFPPSRSIHWVPNIIWGQMGYMLRFEHLHSKGCTRQGIAYPIRYTIKQWQSIYGPPQGTGWFSFGRYSRAKAVCSAYGAIFLVVCKPIGQAWSHLIQLVHAEQSGNPCRWFRHSKWNCSTYSACMIFQKRNNHIDTQTHSKSHCVRVLDKNPAPALTKKLLNHACFMDHDTCR